MKFAQMKETPFLSWFDTEEEGTIATIADYQQVTIERQDGSAESKWAIFFNEHEKGMILNATNREKLISIFGDDTDDSIGKQVILYWTETKLPSGAPAKGLRIREVKKSTGKATKADKGFDSL